MKDLIAEYVSALTSTLKGQRGAGNLVAEIEDHLRETAEALIDAGRTEVVAQETAIMRLGDPELVARALLSARARSLALPNRFTAAAGRLSWVAAAVWAALTLLVSPANASRLVDADLTAPWLAGLALVGAGLVGAVVVGLAVRSGGRRDLRTLSSGLLMLLFVVGLSAFPWLVGLLGTLLMTSAVLVASRAPMGTTRSGSWIAVPALQVSLVVPMLGLTSGLSDRAVGAAVGLALTFAVALVGYPATSWLGVGPVLLAIAWPLATSVLVGLQALRVGAPGYYGDYPLAWSIALAIGCLSTALGCALIGHRMAGERPVGSTNALIVTV